MVNEVAENNEVAQKKEVAQNKDKYYSLKKYTAYTLTMLGAGGDAAKTHLAADRVVQRFPKFPSQPIVVPIVAYSTALGRGAQSIAFEGTLTTEAIEDFNLGAYLNSLFHWWRTFGDTPRQHLNDMVFEFFVKPLILGGAMSYGIMAIDSYNDMTAPMPLALLLGTVDTFQAWQSGNYLREAIEDALLQTKRFLNLVPRLKEEDISLLEQGENARAIEQANKALRQVPGWQGYGYRLCQMMRDLLKDQSLSPKQARSKLAVAIEAIAKVNPSVEPYKDLIADTLNHTLTRLQEKIRYKEIAPEVPIGLIRRELNRSLWIKVTQNTNNNVWWLTFFLFSIPLAFINAAFADISFQNVADELDWDQSGLTYNVLSWLGFIGMSALTLGVDGMFMPDGMGRLFAKKYKLPGDIVIEQGPDEEKVKMQEGRSLQRGGHAPKPSNKALIISGAIIILGGAGAMLEGWDGGQDLEEKCGSSCRSAAGAMLVVGGVSALLAGISNVFVDGWQSFRFWSELLPKPKSEANAPSPPAASGSSSWRSKLSFLPFKKAQLAENATELLPLRPTSSKMSPGASSFSA